MDKPESPFVFPDWSRLQQQYIGALDSLSRAQPGTDGTAWNEALDYWWKSIESCLPAGNQPVYDSLLQQSRTFYTLADQFAALIKDIGALTSPDDWQAIMAGHFERMKAELDARAAAARTSGEQSDGQSSSAIWQQVMSRWPGVSAPGEKAGTTGLDGLADLFNLPGLGPGREFQDKYRKSILLWHAYQERSREFQASFTGLAKLALDRLAEKITTLAEAGGKITSLKQIYALWIDANEEVFAQFAYNEDYSKLYGELVNSLMSFRRQANEVLDEILSLLNLPTLKSMNTVHQRQHQMGNELRSGREIQRRIEQDLAALRVELGKIQDRSVAAKRTRKPGHTRASRKQKKDR